MLLLYKYSRRKRCIVWNVFIGTVYCTSIISFRFILKVLPGCAVARSEELTAALVCHSVNRWCRSWAKENYQKDFEIDTNKIIISPFVSESVGGINLFGVR